MRTKAKPNGAYSLFMNKPRIEIDERLLREARKVTGLKNTSEIVQRSLELLVTIESRKGMLLCFGTGIWRGDLKAMRRNRI